MAMMTLEYQKRSLELHREGYTHIPASQIRTDQYFQLALLDLQQDMHNLPLDQGTRQRRYSRTVMLPGEEFELSRSLGSEYWQTSAHNPEAGGVVRKLAPLEARTLRNAALQSLVESCARICDLGTVWPASRFTPVQVGIHLIRLWTRPGVPGVALPPRLHQDGEFFTCICALGRHGVRGGETEIAALGANHQPGPLLFRAALQTPLDLMCVLDPLVYHNVCEVNVEDDYGYGWRDSILVDFSPLVPVITGVDGSPLAALQHSALQLPHRSP